jgi:hypothetical protein
MYTVSVVVQVTWVWCQRPGDHGIVLQHNSMLATIADTISRRLEPLPKLYTCLWRWAKRKPETCKAEVNKIDKWIKNFRITLVIIHVSVPFPHWYTCFALLAIQETFPPQSTALCHNCVVISSFESTPHNNYSFFHAFSLIFQPSETTNQSL